MQLAAPGGFRRRRRQQAGDGVRPKLQQPATHGQTLPLRLFRQPRETLRQRFAGGEDGNLRRQVVGSHFS